MVSVKKILKKGGSFKTGYIPLYTRREIVPNRYRHRFTTIRLVKKRKRYVKGK
jgi:hypothetical protein